MLDVKYIRFNILCGIIILIYVPICYINLCVYDYTVYIFSDIIKW